MNSSHAAPVSDAASAHLVVAGRDRPHRPSRFGAVKPSTVRTIVADAAHDAIAALCTDPNGDAAVVYVPASHHIGCDAVAECLPLGPVLDVDDGCAGHLHRLRSWPCDGAGDSPGARFHQEVPLRALAVVMSATVARDLLDVELAHVRHSAEHLQVALHSNRTIGVAMGVLMATLHVDRDRAFDILRAASQRQNRKVRDLAADVEYMGTIPGERATG